MATIGHAMAFETWRSLTGQGLSTAEVTDLVLRFVTTVDDEARERAPQR